MIKFECLIPTMSQERMWEFLGFIPEFLSESNPENASRQLDSNYKHGGGWRPTKSFILVPGEYDLQYPNDPPTRAIARAMLRDEEIIVYEHSWVAIRQPNGKFEVARMD